MDAITTRLSQVDGEGGSLRYRGRAVQDLLVEPSVATVVAWLWRGAPAEGDEGLGAARVWAAAQRDRVAPALEAADAMVALRGAVARLEHATPVQLVAAVGVYGAWWVRGACPDPDPTRDHASDLLRLAGRPHGPDHARALATYLGAVADHGTNASTFAARVVASTGSDPTSAVVAAIGALKGPLHGGAPGPVLDMLDAIGRPEAAEAWLARRLASGERIMGMGHRVYRARDPRVALLESATDRLGPAAPRHRLARAVEAEATRQLAVHRPGRALHANVEFATAVLLEALGWPREAFSAVFAAGRVVGWLAHVEEQRATGRLIRPRAVYVGEAAA